MLRQRATSSIYRAPPTRPTFVRADLRGFDHDAMTVIPGPRTRVLAPKAHRFLPAQSWPRMAGEMLAPSPSARHDGARPGRVASAPASVASRARPLTTRTGRCIA